jgi:hypothetical protein
MVATFPMTYFPNQMNWIVWGTASKGGEQIDHVGRSREPRTRASGF